MSVTFGGTDLTTLAGVKITRVAPTRPSYTRHKVSIPGKPGSYDFGGNQPEDYEIIVDVLVTADSRSDLRTRINALFTALDGKKTLTADGIFCEAQVYSEISMDEHVTGRWARGTIVFECDST